MAYMSDDTPRLGAASDPAATFATNDFTTWQKYNTGPGSALPVVTPNAGTAPDGTQTASRIVLNRGTRNTGNTGDYCILRIGVDGNNGSVYTDSVYLKKATTAAVSVALRAAMGTTGETDRVVALTDQWQRFAVTSPAVTGKMQYFDLILWDNNPLTPGTSQVADVLAWGFRVDPGTAVLGTDYTASTTTSSISPLAMVGLAIAGFALFGRPVR